MGTEPRKTFGAAGDLPRNWRWRVGGTGSRWDRVASPRRPAFYGGGISLRRPMLTVRSGIGPYRRFLGTDERVAVLGRENRINQQVREGLAHTCITRQNGVVFIQKRPPFQDESGTASLSRAKAPDFAKPTSRWTACVDARPPALHTIRLTAAAILSVLPCRGCGSSRPSNRSAACMRS